MARAEGLVNKPRLSPSTQATAARVVLLCEEQFRERMRKRVPESARRELAAAVREFADNISALEPMRSIELAGFVALIASAEPFDMH